MSIAGISAASSAAYSQQTRGAASSSFSVPTGQVQQRRNDHDKDDTGSQPSNSTQASSGPTSSLLSTVA